MATAELPRGTITGTRPGEREDWSWVQDECKNATILFVDIVDSTGMIADRDPEVAVELLRTALNLLSTAARRHDGTVNQFTGDGLMVLFGAPVMNDEHAFGACCAALEMHAVLRRSDIGVKIRIGIHTGEVVVHTLRLGTLESLNAAGEAVHVAARLQQGAPPGGTWISETTFALARDRIVAQRVGSVPLRGFQVPVSVYLLEAADPSLTRFDVAGRRGLSPFVNRRKELDALGAAYTRSAEGRGCAVVLDGEAGVGKSRLIREFVAALRGTRVLEARCTRWRDTSGFHSIRVLTRHLFGLDVADSVVRIQTKLDTAFAGRGALSPEALDVLAELHDLEPGKAWTKLDPRERRRRIIDGTLAMLLQAAVESPLLILVDDAHWIDHDTEEVLERLVQELDDSRLLLLLAFRSDHRPTWTSSPKLIQIPLAPLTSTHARELARTILGARGEDDAIVAELAIRTGGNPFFIEEAAIAPNLARMPPTVRALLGARLDRLSGEEKRFLEALAISGEPTSIDLLEAVIDADQRGGKPGAMAMALGLEREGLLRFKGVGDSARLICRHSLLQEVVYQGMTRTRRRALHARVAAAMERSAGSRSVEEPAVLARHARLGDAWEAALRYARAAGARAASHFANSEAVRFYEEALEALAHLPKDTSNFTCAIDLRFALRDPLFRLGRIAALRATLNDAAALAEQLGDSERLGQLYIFQSHHAWLAGDYVTAIAAAERASALADMKNDAALRLRAVFQRALGELGQGASAAAAEGMAEVAAKAEDATLVGRFGLDVALVVVALGYRSRALTDLGLFEEAELIANTCQARAAELARPFSSIFAAVAEGYLLLRRGISVRAVMRFSEAMALCDRAEADLMRPVVQSFLGAAELASGMVAAAVEHLELAVNTASAMGFLFQQPLRLAFLAEALCAVGRTNEAAHRANEAQDLAMSQGEMISLVAARRVSARISTSLAEGRV